LLERSHECPPEAEDLLHGAVGRPDQPLDRPEVESVRLHLTDQLQARHMLRSVEAGASLDFRRREEPARLVRADVPHGHADPLSEFVDRYWCVIRHTTDVTP